MPVLLYYSYYRMSKNGSTPATFSNNFNKLVQIYSGLTIMDLLLIFVLSTS